jgi:DNA-binding XRE family transcriptional regulator
VPVTLKSLRKQEYEFEPKTLGEHIRKRRLQLKLTQKEAAKRLKVNAWTMLNWENGDTQPLPKSVPRIILFLGYDPIPELQETHVEG